MLSEQEIQKLIADMDSVRTEIKDLRSKFYSLDKRKEEFFREKRKISSDIFSRIKNAQAFKEKRNSLTSVVKNSKMTKEEVEQKMQTLDKEIHQLKEDKQKILQKLGVDDPMKLKKNIKQLEFKIETEGLTFEKEKELMKVLTKMKKQFETAKSVVDIEHKLDVRFRELRELRQEFDASKKIVQQTAKESQKQHVELIESSKEIDVLRAKENELETNIGSLKGEIYSLNDEISKKMEKLDGIKKILSENNVRFKEDIEKSNNELLKQKDVEVQEKLKKGKKLTTEDLLVLQRTMKG
jgi:uncharacterized coiled-coil DUF342 family protein